MKTIITAIAIAAISIFAVEKAMAEDWDKSQHNFKVDMNEFNFEYRAERNSTEDHIQFGYKPMSKLNLQLRYRDNADAEDEYRFRGTYDVYEGEHLYAKQRLEYRHWQNKDDFWRVRPIIGVQKKFSDFKVYAETQLTYNVGKKGEKNDFKLDDGQFKVGVDYKITKDVTLGGFVQRDTDGDFNNKQTFFGTNIKYSF